MLPRAMTSDERAAVRAANQWSELFLVIPNPASVYTARVNGTPANLDRLTEIAYDGGSGTLANVKVGMTIWVGSSAGAYDRGQARIRLAPDSDTFFIGTESEIDVHDNDYLTVIDEFGLWQRPVRAVSATEAYMDYDVAYSDQHTNRLPVVVMGGPAVVELVGSTASVTFDASGSWAPGGGSATYSWSAPTASATSGTSTATPTFTFNATGRHRVSCTVTIDGVANTRYEYVYVLGSGLAAVTQFRLGSLSGSKAEGGYSFGLTLYAEAANTDVRDRAQVLLCERVRSAGVPATLGYATGRENILAVGWISGETLEWSPDLSTVAFQVDGAAAWLNRITAYPQGIENTGDDTAADAWTNYNNLTVTAMMWHLLTWRSTVARAIDCYVEASDLRAVELSAAASTLWEQISTIAGLRLLAAPCCDRLSRLFIQIDAQYRAEDARGDVAEVLTLTTADWQPPLRITRAPVADTCQVDLSGVGYDGTVATAYFALAPGRTFKRFGRVQSQQSLLLADQAHANSLAGLVAGQANNQYPSIPIQLAGRADRFIDIAPDCYLTLTLAAGDTPRGVAFTKRLIPRRIDYAWDGTTGVLLASVDTEAETAATLAATGDSPPAEPTPPVSPCPGGYHYDPDLGTCVLDADPPPNPGEGSGNVVVVATAATLGRTFNFLADIPLWDDITGAITGAITWFALHPFDPAHRAVCVTSDGIWTTSDLDAAAPTWTLKVTRSAAKTGTGLTIDGKFNFENASASITQDGLCWVACYGGVSSTTNAALIKTTDWFETVSYQTPTASGMGSSNTCTGWVQASNRNASIVFFVPINESAVTGTFADWRKVRKSTDGGSSWSTLLTLASGGQGFLGGGEFAYAGGDATLGERFMYLLRSDSSDFVEIMRSTNYGAAFSDVETVDRDSSLGGVGTWYANVATHDADDVIVLVVDAVNNLTRLERSSDGGDTWSETVLSGGGWGAARSLGRWPYDGDRLYVLTGDSIRYSAAGGVDFDDPACNKNGNWAAVMGAAFADPINVVPVWVSA